MPNRLQKKESIMGKRVFMFPGQGAQYVGMGKEFYDTMPEVKAIYEKASEVTGLDIPALCFTENDQINITEYTQIAMVTTEAAIFTALRLKGIEADVTAGLSLGEYGALIAAGVLSMEDAFALVRKRGIYMQEAVPTGGAMSAILGLDGAIIDEICTKTAEEMNQVVSVANYNCPGQIVITGAQEAVEKAGERCKEAGAKRVVALKVSGPFHSQMLKEAGIKLEESLAEVTVNDPQIPYLANVTADYVTTKEPIKELLAKQVCAPVKWQQTVERLIADGADEFVEIGPGRTLCGFLKKINRDVTAVNIDTMEDFNKYVNR